MIYSEKLRAENVVKKLLTKRAEHYMPIERSKVIEERAYEMRPHDTIYTISQKLFGDGGHSVSNWVHIADNNPLQRVQRWKPGDTINLPMLIVRKENTPSI